MDLADRDRESAATLRSAEHNDPALRSLAVLADPSARQPTDQETHVYYSTGVADLARLGAALANISNLWSLSLHGGDAALAGTNAGNNMFLEGLEQNASIRTLIFRDYHILGESGHEVVDRAANNEHLENFGLLHCRVDARSLDALTSVLSGRRNPLYVALTCCNIDDSLLGNLTTRPRGLHQLKGLYLNGNNFGRNGCETIATLLRSPNSKLVKLDLSHNPGIDDNCARIIANALRGNRQLQQLDLYHCAITADGLDSTFSQILCNPSTANDSYFSNHTLRDIGYHNELPTNLSLLLGFTPIEKILRTHANLDMTNMLELDQKLLPQVLLWLEKARECSTAASHNVGAKSLSIIYQFIRALPMAVVPPTANELKEIARHHGLRQVKNKDGYVVGDRVYTNCPAGGPWGYVVGHNRSSVFVTMSNTNIGAEIIRRSNRTVWNAPMLCDEATLAACRHREQLNVIMLRYGLKRDWNEDGYVVGDRLYVNSFVGRGNYSKRHCGIWGYVVGHTRSSVWIATDHARVDGEVLERRSRSVSKTLVHR